MALAWVCTRSEQVVSDEYHRRSSNHETIDWPSRVEHHPDYKERETLWAEQGVLRTPLAEAVLLLNDAFEAGKCKAVGFSPRDDKHGEIPAYKWPYLEIGYDGFRIIVVRVGDSAMDYGDLIWLPDRRVFEYMDVRVTRKGLLSTFPADSARAGRPSKYDWPAFIDEVCSQLDHEGDFDSSVHPGWRQSVLCKRMTNWCESNWGEVPSESTMKAKVRDGRKQFLAQREDADEADNL